MSEEKERGIIIGRSSGKEKQIRDILKHDGPIGTVNGLRHTHMFQDEMKGITVIDAGKGREEVLEALERAKNDGTKILVVGTPHGIGKMPIGINEVDSLFKSGMPVEQFTRPWFNKEEKAYQTFVIKKGMFDKPQITLGDRMKDLGLYTWAEFKEEYDLIQEKESKLNRTDRDRICRVYEIIQRKIKENE